MSSIAKIIAFTIVQLSVITILPCIFCVSRNNTIPATLKATITTSHNALCCLLCPVTFCLVLLFSDFCCNITPIATRMTNRMPAMLNNRFANAHVTKGSSISSDTVEVSVSRYSTASLGRLALEEELLDEEELEEERLDEEELEESLFVVIWVYRAVTTRFDVTLMKLTSQPAKR